MPSSFLPRGWFILPLPFHQLPPARITAIAPSLFSGYPSYSTLHKNRRLTPLRSASQLFLNIFHILLPQLLASYQFVGLLFAMEGEELGSYINLDSNPGLINLTNSGNAQKTLQHSGYLYCPSQAFKIQLDFHSTNSD